MGIYTRSCFRYQLRKTIKVNHFNETILRGGSNSSRRLSQFREKVEQLFSSHLGNLSEKNQSKEKRTSAFALVMLHLVSLIRDNQENISRTGCTDEVDVFSIPDDFEMDKDDEWKLFYSNSTVREVVNRGFAFAFSYNNSSYKIENHIFWYKKTTFSKGILKLVCKELGRQLYLPTLRGFSYENPRTGMLKARSALLIPNFQKLKTFYFENQELIVELLDALKLDEEEIRIKPESLVSVRKITKRKDKNGKMIKVTQEIPYDMVRGKRIIRDVDIPYLKRLTEMYNKIELSLEPANRLTEDEIKKCQRIFESKNPIDLDSLERGGYPITFNYQNFAEEVRLRSEILKESKFSPRAVLITDDSDNMGRNNGFQWNRIYGNVVDSLPREYQSLLKINDMRTVELDVKGCYPQMYFLHLKEFDTSYKASLDEKPNDFYSYDFVKNLLYFKVGEIETFHETGEIHFDAFKARSKMKLIFQICLNSPNIDSALSAMNQEESLRPITKEDLETIISSIVKENPCLRNYFFNEGLEKKLTLKESELFMNFGYELMKQNILYVHHFDSVFIQSEMKEKVKKIFDDVCCQRYKTNENPVTYSFK